MLFFPLALTMAESSSDLCATGDCVQRPFFLYTLSQNISQVWQEGNYDLYVTGYAWHNRYTYPRYKIGTYNEWAWGGGLGKGLYDEKGNWHGLYAMGFSDSHKNPEPIGGYGFLKPLSFLPSLDPFELRLGFTLFVTMRRDILHNIPFPGILPLASIHYQRGTVFFTYIPGANRAGNVLFVFGKWAVPLY